MRVPASMEAKPLVLPALATPDYTRVTSGNTSLIIARMRLPLVQPYSASSCFTSYQPCLGVTRPGTGTLPPVEINPHRCLAVHQHLLLHRLALGIADHTIVAGGAAQGIGFILADTALQITYAVLLLGLQLHALRIDGGIQAGGRCEAPRHGQCQQQRGAKAVMMIWRAFRGSGSPVDAPLIRVTLPFKPRAAHDVLRAT
ncbi:hypothetical protein WR25_01999 [Diploscapter pachys]|uniref:Uncharacterized protein n=1 Tax=Diploscapter pachys TaxID=2018661 RepID=A0A2A2M4P1_9BILA|nr:hypothetical protein WR25_01999 [Diploscapter pachys]